MATKTRTKRITKQTKDKPVDAEIRRAADRAGITVEPKQDRAERDRAMLVQLLAANMSPTDPIGIVCGALEQLADQVWCINCASQIQVGSGAEGRKPVESSLYGVEERLRALQNFVLEHLDVEFTVEAGRAS